MDGDGVWSDYAYGATFKVGEYQEDYSASLAFTGSWVRSAWGQASDGYLSTAAEAGASAPFAFTGSNIRVDRRQGGQSRRRADLRRRRGEEGRRSVRGKRLGARDRVQR